MVMSKGKLRVALLLFLFIITSLVSPASVFAAEAGSQAGSPGVQGQKPLAYVGATLEEGGKVENGAVDIPLNPKFKLEFDKNVVNSLFWTNNSQCFSMKDGNNENIPLKVTKVDDTVDFSLRQYIFVQPVNQLNPGTSYQLSVSPELQAKNGVATLGGTTNGQGVTISFKTLGEAVQEPQTPAADSAAQAVSAAASQEQAYNPTQNPNANNSPNDKPASFESANSNNVAGPAEVGDSEPVQNQNNESEPVDSGNSDNPGADAEGQTALASADQSSPEAKKGLSTTTWVAIAGAVLVIGWIAVEIISRKRKK